MDFDRPDSQVSKSTVGVQGLSCLSFRVYGVLFFQRSTSCALGRGSLIPVEIKSMSKSDKHPKA